MLEQLGVAVKGAVDMSWPVLLLFSGLLIAIVLLRHPQPFWSTTSSSADRQRTNAVVRDDDRYWRGTALPLCGVDEAT
jgi:hypothetical protein